MAHYEVINLVNGNKFVTDDYQLAYEVRKCSDTNCYSEDGVLQEEALKFIEVNGDDDLILVKHDNVTRMYRGVCPTDGTDSLFAVKNGMTAATWYSGNNDWLTPVLFGSIEDYTFRCTNHPLSIKRLEVLDAMELLWERDDNDTAQA